jgi:hypothetical protein
MNTNKTKRNAARPKYEPTSQEQAAIGKFFARNTARPAPRLKVLNDKEGGGFSPDHPVGLVGKILLMDALGTADLDFYHNFVNQLAKASSRGGQTNERSLNFMLSVVKGIQPRDQLEAMLAAQMAAVHIATMRSARQLADVENVPQQDSAERLFNKLARTYVTQMEALKRYRTGGEQKVTVQHVSVSEGGQAIVGNVTQAARETAKKKAAAPPPALPHSQTPAMPILGEPEAVTVPFMRKSGK